MRKEFCNCVHKSWQTVGWTDWILQRFLNSQWFIDRGICSENFQYKYHTCFTYTSNLQVPRKLFEHNPDRPTVQTSSEINMCNQYFCIKLTGWNIKIAVFLTLDISKPNSNYVTNGWNIFTNNKSIKWCVYLKNFLKLNHVQTACRLHNYKWCHVHGWASAELPRNRVNVNLFLRHIRDLSQ